MNFPCRNYNKHTFQYIYRLTREEGKSLGTKNHIHLNISNTKKKAFASEYEKKSNMYKNRSL